jgi:microsomal dipeptidase-like Zn-dependent dipeptidase
MHFYLPGQIEMQMNINLPHESYQISESSQQFHDGLFVADLHTDSLLWKRDLTQRSGIGHVDLPRLQAGNVGLQLFAAVTKSPSGQNYNQNESDSDNITMLAVSQLWPPRTWFSLLQRALYQLEKLWLLEEESEGQLRVIETARDLQEVLDAREQGNDLMAGIFVIEGAHPLEGRIDNIEVLFEAGLRVIGMTHFFDNELGGSLHGTSGEGLTDFGRQVVKRANELGLIIDVVHASPEMVTDILELSTRPVILSHGGVKDLCDVGRNLDNEVMLKIAAKGGLLGIGYWDGAVCDISPVGIVRSIRHAIDLMGADHVALGSDYDGTTAVVMDTSELGILTHTMLEEGFTESEIRQIMGGNARDFFLENLPQ